MSFSGESTQLNADYLGGSGGDSFFDGGGFNISTGSSKLSAGGLAVSPVVLWVGVAAVVLAAVFLLKRRR